jgi:multidrug transporter EmrE-like cation transporter
MITTGSKWFYGLGFVSYVLAMAYGWTTGGNGLGPVSVGYKGAVGDHFGYGILIAAAVVSIVLGVVVTAARDAEAEAVAQVAGTATVPAVTPAGASYWPPIAAFGAALVVIGLVSEPLMFIAGLVVLGIVLIEWAVQSWADRATGDPETNRRIRNRLMNPIEFPAAAVLALAALALAFSRVFLTLSAESAVWVALAIAVVVVVGGFLVAARPRISSNVVVGLLVVAAVVILGFGIAAGVNGTRTFEEHEGEAEEGAPAPSLGPPVVVEVAT